jgi:hypothetical protein
MRRLVLATAVFGLLMSSCSTEPPANLSSPVALPKLNAQTYPEPWVIRTSFASDEQWEQVRKLIAAPQVHFGDEFFAYVRYVDDRRYQDSEPFDVVRSLPDDYPGMFCFVVDDPCLEDLEHPVLVVGFYPTDDNLDSFRRKPRETPPGDIATFRALPSQIQKIQNNLSIANLDFEDYSNHVDEDGVFRGRSR